MIRVAWFWVGAIVTRRFIGSISCQVAPSELGSWYCRVETALWSTGSGGGMMFRKFGTVTLWPSGLVTVRSFIPGATPTVLIESVRWVGST